MLGAAILRPIGFEPLKFESIRKLFIQPENMGFWEGVRHNLPKLFRLGGDTFASLWLGCVLAGGVAAIVLYYVTLRFVAGHRLIKAERMARRARRRLEQIRMEQTLEKSQSKREQPHD